MHTCMHVSLGLPAPLLVSPGISGPPWAILGRSGPYWASLGFPGLFCGILVHSGPFWPILGHSGPFWAILGSLCTSLQFWAILGLSGPPWTILGHSGPFWAILGYAWQFWAILGLHAYMLTCLHAYMPTCLHAYMLWSAAPLLAYNIASVRPPAGHPILAGLVFQAYSCAKCHHMRSTVSTDTSYLMSCPDHGITCFTMGNLTVLDSHQLTIAPNLETVGVQTCTTGDCRDGFFASCREPWCSPDLSRARIWCTERPTLQSYLVKSPPR